MNFFERFLATLEKVYPESARALDLKARIFPQLMCPETIRLPSSLKDEAARIVRAFFELRSINERARALEKIHPPIPDPGHTSVLMSYDFHVDESGSLRLIEINTNASLSLLTDAAYKTHGIENPFSSSFRSEIIACFNEELREARIKEPRNVAIIDQDPESQRMYAEFVFYGELFRTSGFDVRIGDAKDLRFADGRLSFGDGWKVDLIYNRHTDFYFDSSATLAMREAMREKVACITPHPHEYRLLADKDRLLELSRTGAVDALSLSSEAKKVIRAALLECRDVKDFANPDELWAEKKRWFFKPKRSHGAKAAYRGEAVRRPMFAQIIAGDYLAQEYLPAPITRLANGQDYKYDLRFFVYRDRIQLACARLYQGQVTNSQTAGGGTAAIEWIGFSESHRNE